MASEVANKRKLQEAFEEHFDAISRYCHRRLASADANDATAQVFAVAWRRVEDMPRGDATLPWLYGVARNCVSSTRRSARRLANLRVKLNGHAGYAEPGPEAVIVRNEQHAHVVEALATLSPLDQEVLRLRTYERLSTSEIAAVLGCSVEAAKKRSSRAVKRLRRAAGLPEPQGAGSGSRVIEEGGDG